MKRLLLAFSIFLVLAARIQSQTTESLRSRNFSDRTARRSEAWVRSGVVYEIYARSFSASGDFAGIERRLPELSRLGVTILWIMPIHPVGELHRKGTLGSPYSVRDYYGINPEFGTLEDFRRLVERAHQLGFHLVIDLVANHTSWDSKLIVEHPEWFVKDSAGNIIPPNPDWTDVAKLDYSKPGLRRYMIEMMKYWVRDVGIDGFRCDVAEMVPTDFWEEARAALDSLKPVMMLSEGAFPEHHLKAFDLTYGWNVYGLLAPLVHGTLPPSAIDSVLKREAAIFPAGSLRLRFSSNHDENAWDSPDVLKFGRDGAMLSAALVNTLPGVPLLYNGQEADNAKKLPLFEKDSIDWTRGADFRKLYTALFAMRKDHPALTGKMIRLSTSDDRHVYAFARVSGPDRVIVVLNFGKEVFNGGINLASANILPAGHFVLHDLIGDATTPLPASGVVPLSLKPFGFQIVSVSEDPR